MKKTKQKLFCRKAILGDMKLFYDWANDPEARKNSLNRKRISWNSHKSWFKKKIRNKKTILYVFKKQDVPLGQVRFDKQNKTVRLSFSICKKFRGQGFGKKMVKMAIRKCKLGKKITLFGEVRSRNSSSIKIFKSLSFTRDSINKIHYFKKIYI